MLKRIKNACLHHKTWVVFACSAEVEVQCLSEQRSSDKGPDTTAADLPSSEHHSTQNTVGPQGKAVHHCCSYSVRTRIRYDWTKPACSIVVLQVLSCLNPWAKVLPANMSQQCPVLRRATQHTRHIPPSHTMKVRNIH